MPLELTDQQIISVLATYGVSEKSFKILGDSGHAFPKASTADEKSTGRDTQRYPHFSPGSGETPPHITNIRFIKQAGDYDIIQRFHQHISQGRGGLSLTEELHDRFRAVHRTSGQIHTASSSVRVAALEKKTLDALRGYSYTVSGKVTERGRDAVMSKAVMNRFNLGVR